MVVQTSSAGFYEYNKKYKKYYDSFPEREAMEKRYAAVFDLRKCVGCHACAVACKSENNVPLGVFRAWVRVVEKGVYPNVQKKFNPRICNHCDNPPCVQVCPAKATYKREDGVVLIDYDKCIGCGYCIQACPYDARFFNPIRNTADKCTFCDHRIEKGLEPACMSTCIGHARYFGDLNDPTSEVSKLVGTEDIEVIKSEFGTEPMLFYIGLDKDTVGHLKARSTLELWENVRKLESRRSPAELADARAFTEKTHKERLKNIAEGHPVAEQAIKIEQIITEGTTESLSGGD